MKLEVSNGTRRAENVWVELIKLMGHMVWTYVLFRVKEPSMREEVEVRRRSTQLGETIGIATNQLTDLMARLGRKDGGR